MLLALAPVAVTLVVSCGVSDSSSYRPIGGADVAELLATTTSTTTTTTATTSTPPQTAPPTTATPTTVPTQTVDLYFVSGCSLQAVKFPLTPDPAPRQVLEALLTGLSRLGSAATGLRSAIPSGSTFEVTVRTGVAYVDLPAAALTSVPSDGRLEFGQLVLTLVSNIKGVGQVSFSVSGTAIAFDRGDGSQVEAGKPVSRDDYASLLNTKCPTASS